MATESLISSKLYLTHTDIRGFSSWLKRYTWIPVTRVSVQKQYGLLCNPVRYSQFKQQQYMYVMSKRRQNDAHELEFQLQAGK